MHTTAADQRASNPSLSARQLVALLPLLIAACGGGDGGGGGALPIAIAPAPLPAPAPGPTPTPTPTPAPTPAPAPAPGPAPAPPPSAAGIPGDFDSDAHMSARAALPTAARISAAAASSNLCQTGAYPAQLDWAGTPALAQPQAASSGTPRIEQVRAGKVIATYDSLGVSGCHQPENNDASPNPVCGVFSRGFGRNWREGDEFLIYPAVYEGVNQHPWIGPAYGTHAQFNSQVPSIPRNITLRGVTVNGQRPVLRLNAAGVSNNTLGQGLIYLDQSSGITIENLDIDAGTAGPAGKAGIYLRAATNLTLRDVRVTGFKRVSANGIFAADGNAGVLRLDRVELSGNGGDSGPEHNIYVNASTVDPGFTVWMTGSWSRDVYYGHTFKSRAQVNLLEGNYFQGGRPVNGAQAEAYLIDLPEGGRALIRNNLLAKNASGANSNGAFITYAVEGVRDQRAQSLVIEHNSFLAYAKTWDGSHSLYPIFTHWTTANAATWPFAKASVNNNLFAGFCDNDGRAGYRGTAPWHVSFDDLHPDFSPRIKTETGNPAVMGRPRYVHRTGHTARTAATAGAFD